MVVRRKELDTQIAHRQIRVAPGPIRTGVLFALLRPGALARDLHANPAFHFCLANRFPQLQRPLGDVAVVFGPDQQIHCAVTALLVEHLEEVRLAVADIDQAGMGHVGGHGRHVAVMLDPNEGFLLLNGDGECRPFILRRFRLRGQTLRLQHAQRQSAG